MDKDKYDFILDLVENKKLNLSQRERVLKLSAEEMKKDGIEFDERLRKIETTISNTIGKLENNKEQNPKNEAIHNPSKITEYLKKFKENTALKFTTHIWDENKYATIQDFIDELNKDKSYSELYLCNRELYGLIQ